MQTNSNNRQSNRRTQARRWTREEDDRLLRHVRVFPQNLSRCFHIVAEETGRIPGAFKKGNLWLIPGNAIKPFDRRKRGATSDSSKLTIGEKTNE